MDDYNDLGAVLLGGGLRATDDGFDPFAIDLGSEPGEEGAEDLSGGRTEPGDDGDIDTAIVYDRSNSFGRHDGDHASFYRSDDRDGSFLVGRSEQDSNRSLPWQGTGSAHVIGAGERRDREAKDAGNRRLSRAAEEHGGNPQSGRTGTPAEDSARVDSSIASASERILTDLRKPLDTRSAVARWKARGEKDLGKKEYQKQGITAPPTFDNTRFEAVVTGLKANASGDWILTLKVDRNARQSVYSLDDAFGLALNVTVERVRHRAEETG